MKVLYRYILEYLRGINGFEGFEKPLAAIGSMLVIILVAWFAFFLGKRILVGIMSVVSRRTRTTWDDIMVRNKVFTSLAHFIPAAIFFYSAGFSMPDLKEPLSGLSPEALKVLSGDYYLWIEALFLKLAKVYMIITFALVASRLLNSLTDIYNTMPYSHHRPVKGYVQLIKIIVYFFAGIYIVSILLGKDPTVLIAGLGAMVAVLLLIFKDTILGFVASIQLSANQMVAIGDWIDMPGHRADGIVTDITLNTVKVQNWDNTITTIPTYSLVAESFSNWKGMVESTGRRIKRAVFIDLTSVRFCTNEMLENYKRFEIIRNFLVSKQKEMAKMPGAEFQLTNVGVFRKYVTEYLWRNQQVNQEMPFLIRHLPPGERGLPIEIYMFSKDKEWSNYENLQSEIFEHILAIIPEFDLRVYQAPFSFDPRTSSV
jgi:miniconductance mechanosensitive channel